MIPRSKIISMNDGAVARLLASFVAGVDYQPLHNHRSLRYAFAFLLEVLIWWWVTWFLVKDSRSRCCGRKSELVSGVSVSEAVCWKKMTLIKREELFNLRVKYWTGRVEVIWFLLCKVVPRDQNLWNIANFLCGNNVQRARAKGSFCPISPTP